MSLTEVDLQHNVEWNKRRPTKVFVDPEETDVPSGPASPRLAAQQSSDVLACRPGQDPLAVVVFGLVFGDDCVFQVDGGNLRFNSNLVDADFLRKLRGFAFLFDSLYGDTPEELFEDSVRPMVDRAIGGKNSTVLLYGQTSEDREALMTDRDRGVVIQSMRHAFSLAQRDTEHEYGFSYTMMEIYNDKVYDLLRSDKPVLNVRESYTGEFFADHATLRLCRSANDIRFESMRSVISESQSTSLLTLYITRRPSGTADDDTSNTTLSRLNLVYLSGNERPDLRKQRSRLTMAGTTRGSRALNSLQKVLACIHHSDQQLESTGSLAATLASSQLSSPSRSSNLSQSRQARFIPFRDSTLTKLLKNGIGSNDYTLVVAYISSQSVHAMQTLATLRYAARTKVVLQLEELNKRIQLRKSIQSSGPLSDDESDADEPRTGDDDAELQQLQRQVDITRADNDRLQSELFAEMQRSEEHKRQAAQTKQRLV